MNRRVEIAIRVDGVESFYVVPEGMDRPGRFCHSLDQEVDAVIRATTNVQKTEWNIIRLLVATASAPRSSDDKLEILIDDEGQPAIRNLKTGEVTQL